MGRLVDLFKAQAKAQAEREKERIKNHKSYKSDKIEDLFGHSLGNKPIVTEDKDEKIVLQACEEAKKLVKYFSAKEYGINHTLTYHTPLRTGFVVIAQTTNFAIKCTTLGEVSIDVSIPLNISGDIRLWTTNSSNKTVWTTFTTIQNSNVDKTKLFYYLSKQFSLLTKEEIMHFDDILDTVSR